MRISSRQKVLVGLLNSIKGRGISRLKFFKIIFLMNQSIDCYEFVPYKFGPYSFEMDRDLRLLEKMGILTMVDNKIFMKSTNINFLSSINLEEINFYSKWSESELLNYIYKNFPYYAQNSRIKKIKYKEKIASIAIYTIGYEGLSIDLFIDILIRKGIKEILDIRNNPFSYKYGFSYFWLRKYLPEFGIEYRNIPHLGIENNIRRSFSDKRKLWELYRKKLKYNGELIEKVIGEIQSKPTVLMCFEQNPRDCHRYQLAMKIRRLTSLSIFDFNKEYSQWREVK